MKKIIIIAIFLSNFFIDSAAQHQIKLDNTTSEDIDVKLYFYEDNPLCTPIATSNVTINVPAFTAVTLSTPVALPGSSDNILGIAEVINCSSMPVSVSTNASTPNTTFNLVSCIGWLTFGPLTYTSSSTSTSYSTTWTSLPTVPASLTSTGNTMYLDELVFF